MTKQKRNIEVVFSPALFPGFKNPKAVTVVVDILRANSAIDLYNHASSDLMSYIDKAALRSRLRENKLDGVIEYCHTNDITDLIPVLNWDYLELTPE